MSPADELRESGYAVVRQAFAADAVARLSAEFDRVAAAAADGTLDPNVRCVWGEGRVLRFAQRPGFVDAGTRAWCARPELASLVLPLVGAEVKIAINTMFYKPPGSSDDHVGYHQDWRFRQPATAFRSLATAYVQIGVAVDPHAPDNGGMFVLPGSHRRGDLGLLPEGGVSRTPIREADLRAAGLDPAELVALRLLPGDAALWSPYLVHGSPPNASARSRRFFVCGLVAADCADVGDVAFRAAS